jgi:hypothetical protein
VGWSTPEERRHEKNLVLDGNTGIEEFDKGNGYSTEMG